MMRRLRTMGRTDLPDEQSEALRRAVFWEWFTVAYTSISIVLIALVVGGSQAMRTAWIEDMLSLIPQVSFLVALLFIRRRPTGRFPFGRHRTMGVGHLVAGVALFVVGANLAVEAIVGLVRVEHPSIGTVSLFGHTVWLGWFMMGVMTLLVVGPLIYGRKKAQLAPILHNKLLRADADMAKADWTTTLASIVGVLGVGLGVWWLDGAAALFISAGIVWDGVRNVRAAVLDLMDQRVRAVDDSEPHPLLDDVERLARSVSWVRQCGVRGRDMGQVLHLEVFVVPRARRIRVDAVEELRARIAALDWKVQDVVVVPVHELPDEVRAAR